MLLFKKKYLDLIRSGKKTQTIRLWPHRRMRTGQRSYIPGVGYIHVDLVEPVELENLTDQDAAADGFPNRAALQKELKELYPKELARGDAAYRVCFRLFTPEEAEEVRQEKTRS